MVSWGLSYLVWKVIMFIKYMPARYVVIIFPER